MGARRAHRLHYFATSTTTTTSSEDGRRARDRRHEIIISLLSPNGGPSSSTSSSTSSSGVIACRGGGGDDARRRNGRMIKILFLKFGFAFAAVGRAGDNSADRDRDGLTGPTDERNGHVLFLLPLSFSWLIPPSDGR